MSKVPLYDWVREAGVEGLGGRQLLDGKVGRGHIWMGRGVMGLRGGMGVTSQVLTVY